MTRAPHPRHSLIPLWLWPNLLGLDSPLVAVAWQWLFAKSFGITLPDVFHLILGLSAWCIYLADRLYDSWRTHDVSHATDRLRFTKQFFIPLTAVMIIAGCINAWLILVYVPRDFILTGLTTAFLVGVYYTIRLGRNLGFASIVPREIICGMLFALGCVIAPFYFATSTMNDLPHFDLAAVFFGVLCSMSCILISLWERDADIATNDRSIATSASRIVPHIAASITFLSAACAVLAIFTSWEIFLSLALSAFALRMLLHMEKQLSLVSLRVLADGVLLTPALFLHHFGF
ncbi:hypothetical protein ACFSSA_06135 [Luteolibacter algae]|uniref:Prenyltransferase n=1 Tax=Luteolibacter algae TaxID=454151 RepID=A0ABW5D8C7_9BACT